MNLLPAVESDDEVSALRDDTTIWSRALDEICRRHDLRGPARVLPEGSAIVAATEHHIVKLFEPWNRPHYEAELVGLSCLDAKTDAPTPHVDAVGQIEGWNYIVMTRLPGATLDSVWPETTLDDRRRDARQLGEFAAQMHALPLHDPNGVHDNWDAFIAHQRANLTEHHRQRGGLSAAMLDEVNELVAEQRADSRRVFLHTELTTDNINVTRDGDTWRLSGVFDFEPAMVGAPIYDWAAISVFVARGDASVLRAAAAGYGAGIDTSDMAWRRGVLAQIMLHRYSHVPNFLRIVGASPPGSTTELLDRLVPG